MRADFVLSLEEPVCMSKAVSLAICLSVCLCIYVAACLYVSIYLFSLSHAYPFISASTVSRYFAIYLYLSLSHCCIQRLRLCVLYLYQGSISL